MNKREELLKRIRTRQTKQNPKVTKKPTLQNLTKLGFEDLVVPAKKENASPTKKHIYETYLMWRSIPPGLKKMSEQMRNDFGFISGDEISDLMTIHTKTKFAETYGVSRVTLNEWDKKYETKKEMIQVKRIMHRMTSRILLSLATTAIKTGKAPEVMAWMKITEDFSEKVSVDHTGEIYTLPEEKKARIKELFKRNAHKK